MLTETVYFSQSIEFNGAKYVIKVPKFIINIIKYIQTVILILFLSKLNNADKLSFFVV